MLPSVSVQPEPFSKVADSDSVIDTYAAPEMPKKRCDCDVRFDGDLQTSVPPEQAGGVTIIDPEAAKLNYELELSKLYALEARTREEPYLHAHSRNSAVIRRQVSIFERCKDVLSDAHTILDWGCRHAADACMVRMFRGAAGVNLYGCDVHALDYRAFFDFARLQYSQLTHPYRLPYEDNFFDAVIGSGVLEHVPNDSESLKELYRVIRPQGHFIMTFLPNKYSYTEWLSRRLHKPHHRRMYALSEARSMFLHHGFVPIRYGYHQVLPSLAGQKGALFDLAFVNKRVEELSRLNPFLERVPPLNKLAANIFMVGQKVEALI